MKLASHSVIIQTGTWPRCCASHPKPWENSHEEVCPDLRPRLWSHWPGSTLKSLETAGAVVHIRARAQGAICIPRTTFLVTGRSHHPNQEFSALERRLASLSCSLFVKSLGETLAESQGRKNLTSFQFFLKNPSAFCHPLGASFLCGI